MTEHYTKSTVSASHWCSKCSKFTQHRVSHGRIGPCLDCVAKLDVEHAEHANRPKQAEAPKQESLF